MGHCEAVVHLQLFANESQIACVVQMRFGFAPVASHTPHSTFAPLQFEQLWWHGSLVLLAQ
jgi:hypothetical protein